MCFSFAYCAFRFKDIRGEVGAVVKLPENRQFWGPHFVDRNPKFYTSLKSDSLPNMWQNSVEFRSVTCEGGVRKKNKEHG